MGLFTPVAIIVLIVFFLSAALRILNEYERGVIFRLGLEIGGDEQCDGYQNRRDKGEEKEGDPGFVPDSLHKS